MCGIVGYVNADIAVLQSCIRKRAGAIIYCFLVWYDEFFQKR